MKLIPIPLISVVTLLFCRLQTETKNIPDEQETTKQMNDWMRATQAFICSIPLLISLIVPQLSYCQSTRLWTQTDRQYLINNLERTKAEILKETKQLSVQQWSFKQDSTKWSIGQVLEHLGLYERIFAQEADIMLSTQPEPQLDRLSKPDSSYLAWMNDPSPHKAEWNAEPLGLMKGADNLTFFLFGRNRIIDFVRNTTYDLKSHFTFRWGEERRRSIHALMVVHFGHTDRHLRQIRRIKEQPDFPKQ
ncbi:DinB family protein [Larkinella terrae]|uniref:DinB family protein n=1 Tax=Larkinella terrae TaxID=2025311 RepID=A0A7K0EDT6_9BACT|nr:DinB family protein [Larkinella terrae]MRS59872.1 DinB family protein [Larkinella terrae]